jgi:hypothetical protein
MHTCRALIAALLLLPATAASSQTESGAISPGTPLTLSIDRHYPMRAGQAIQAHLLYPIYTGNRLLLPSGTTVSGSVVALRPDHPRRVRAMLGGDFTPFHTPVLQFTQIVLANGSSVSLASSTVTDGAPIYRAVAPPPSKGGMIRHEFNNGLTAVRGDVAAFTAPGKADRLLQWVYDRLPYHPERIEKGTGWTLETSAPMVIPAQPVQANLKQQPMPATQSTAPDGAWMIQANLSESLSSETSRQGQAIQAVVAEPIYNPDHSLAVPQGAALIGVVTRAKPARRFGRTGVLNFRFSQLQLPNTESQTVETRLAGADSAADIALNSEGQAQSKPQDKIAIPLFLALLASRPLDRDCGHRGGCSGSTPGKSGLGGAAGLGLVGTIVGIAGGSPYAAAGIGYWGAARAVYDRWIAPGQKIAFPKDTRIVVETTPRRSTPMGPTPSSTP